MALASAGNWFAPVGATEAVGAAADGDGAAFGAGRGAAVLVGAGVVDGGAGVGAAAALPIGVGVPGGRARQAAMKSFFFSLASFSAPLFALYSSLQAPAVLRFAMVEVRAIAKAGANVSAAETGRAKQRCAMVNSAGSSISSDLPIITILHAAGYKKQLGAALRTRDFEFEKIRDLHTERATKLHEHLWP